MSRGDGLRRDAVTRAGYTVMATWSWFLYGFGAVLPLLRAEQGTSRTVMGLHSLALAGGALVAGLAMVRLVALIRRRGVVVAGALLVAAGVVGLIAGESPAWTLPATLLTGTGGSAMLNTAVPMLSEHHGRAGAAALSEANAVAALVGLPAPLAVGAAVGLGWTWRPASLAVVPLLVVLVLTVRAIPPGIPSLDAGPPAGTAGRAGLPALYWVYLALVMSCIAVEFCCSAWAADLLRQRAALSPGTASAGVTAVVTGMAVSRASLGRLALRYPARPLIAWALLIAFGGWTVVWLSTHPAIALAGLVVTGLGIGGHFPLGAALLMASAPGLGDRASSRLSIGIAVASGGGPFALGAIADVTSTHTAFLAVPLLLAAAAAALLGASRLSAGRAS